MKRRVAVDSSVVIAHAKGKAEAKALLVALARADVLLLVPPPVFAETLRGKPADAPVHQTLKALEPTALTAKAGRRAGELLGGANAPSKDTLDALIAACAIEAGADAIATTDVLDFQRIAPTLKTIAP